MRFVHIADMHFDMQFKMLSDKIGIGEQRRYDQRVILRKIINYIKENNIKYFFIAGDLYENQYIRTSTIEYINKLFLEIDDTQIFIAPGNHDPLLKNSYYNNFLWNKNVHIFGPKFERIETDNIDIYGYGFDDFYCSNLNFNDLKISNPNKINILVIHGTLDGANLEDMQYNSMSTRMLQEKGFDYVALGHIHKNNFKNDGKIIYPGSTIAMGFDELGEHGMVTGEISKLGNKLEFIKLDELEFKKQELDCTELNSIEEIIEKINSINLEENKLYEIILIGKRNFEINKTYLQWNDVFNTLVFSKDDCAEYGFNVCEAKELEKLGFDETEISQGGYKVVTTLDYKAQKAVNDAIINNLRNYGLTKDNTQAAVFSFSPIDGKIIAYAGGKDYTKSQYDRVTQAVRPPGSSFKPFVYAAAMEKGISPNDMIEDRPVTL